MQGPRAFTKTLLSPIFFGRILGLVQDDERAASSLDLSYIDHLLDGKAREGCQSHNEDHWPLILPAVSWTQILVKNYVHAGVHTVLAHTYPRAATESLPVEEENKRHPNPNFEAVLYQLLRPKNWTNALQ
jgi:hypothetical protein